MFDCHKYAHSSFSHLLITYRFMRKLINTNIQKHLLGKLHLANSELFPKKLIFYVLRYKKGIEVATSAAGVSTR